MGVLWVSLSEVSSKILLEKSDVGLEKSKPGSGGAIMANPCGCGSTSMKPIVVEIGSQSISSSPG